MRTDLVGGGAGTLVLVLITYFLLQSATLPAPAIMTDISLVVAVLGAGLLLIGIVLPARRVRKTVRRGGLSRP